MRAYRPAFQRILQIPGRSGQFNPSLHSINTEPSAFFRIDELKDYEPVRSSLRITRAYQHTNRRVNKSPATIASLPAPSEWPPCSNLNHSSFLFFYPLTFFQPYQVLQISWKAQHRLHWRLRRLLARRLPRNKAKVAAARELCGFIWALLRTQDCYVQSASPAAS